MNKKLLKAIMIGLTAFGCWGISEVVPNSQTTITVQAKRITISKAEFKQDMTVVKKAINQSGSKSVKKNYNAKVIKKMYRNPYRAYNTVVDLENSLVDVAENAYNSASDPAWSTARVNQTIKQSFNSQVLIFNQLKNRFSPKVAQKMDQLLTTIRQNGVYFDDNVNSKTQGHIANFEEDLIEQTIKMNIGSVAGYNDKNA